MSFLVKYCQFHSTVLQIKSFMLKKTVTVDDICVSRPKVYMYWSVEINFENNDAVKRQKTQRRLCPVTIPCNFESDIKIINDQRIWHKSSQLIKHLLFYIPYKICKHNLKVYWFNRISLRTFDDPSYTYRYSLIIYNLYHIWI